MRKLAILILLLSSLGCQFNPFLLLDKNFQQRLNRLQEVARDTEQGIPNYYSDKHQYHPQEIEYQEEIYKLKPENWPRTKEEIERLTQH